MSEQLRQTELGVEEWSFETRTVWEGAGQPRPVIYTRKVRRAILAEFLGPGEFLDKAWSDITTSALAAGAIAGLSAIAASPPRALLSFEEAFYTCLASSWPQEARRLRVGISTQLRPDGDWQRDGGPGI